MNKIQITILYLVLLSTSISASAHPYTVDWAVSAGGNHITTSGYSWLRGADYPISISSGENGACFICGVYDSQADFGSNRLTSYGGLDGFIAQYSNSGNSVTMKTLGSIKSDWNSFIFTNSTGYFVTGLMSGIVDSLVSNDFHVIDTTTNTIPFISRWDNSHQLMWAKSLSGAGAVLDEAIDNQNNLSIFLSNIHSSLYWGKEKLPLTDTMQTSAIIQIDQNSNILHIIPMTPVDVCNLGVINPTSFLIAGTPSQGYDVTINGTTIYKADTAGCVFIAKVSSSGTVVWYNFIRGEHVLTDCVIIDYFENIYITGSFKMDVSCGSFSFHAKNGVTNNAYLAKYNKLGQLCWMKIIEGGNPAKMAIRNNEEIILCSTYVDSAKFENVKLINRSKHYNPASDWQCASEFFGHNPCYLAAYDTSGSLNWVTNVFSTGIVMAPLITLTQDNYLYITGGFDTTITLDSSFLIDNVPPVTLQSRGCIDIFLLRLKHTQLSINSIHKNRTQSAQTTPERVYSLDGRTVGSFNNFMAARSTKIGHRVYIRQSCNKNTPAYPVLFIH